MDSEDSIRWDDLVNRIQQSDAAAEEQLAKLFHPRVLAMAAVRLRNVEAARDIAQETLLVVLQAVRGAKVREPEKLPAFVYGTARNLVNNYLRAKGKNPQTEPLPADGPAASGGPRAEQLEQKRLVVRMALKRLKPVDRKILLYTLVEGRNPREIAPLVRLSAENVRTRKARAVRAITEEVKKLSRNPLGNHS